MLAMMAAVAMSLRAVPGSMDSEARVWSGQASEHDADHGETDEGDDGAGVAFEVSRQPTVATDPGEGALDDPSLWQNDELVLFGSCDDLQLPTAGIGHDLGHPRSPIAGIGEYLGDRGEAASGVAEQTSRAVAILDAGAMDDNVQQHAEGVDDDVSLAARDPLARVVALWIDRRPPFCAALALWLSIMPTVGPGLRPAASRTSAYSA